MASTVVRRDHGLDPREEVVLDREVLEDRLDHEVAAGERGDVVGGLEQAELPLLLVRGQPPLLDAPCELALDEPLAALGQLPRRLDGDRRHARLDAQLGDPGAHRAEPDHARLPHRSGALARHLELLPIEDPPAVGGSHAQPCVGAVVDRAHEVARVLVHRRGSR